MQIPAAHFDDWQRTSGIADHDSTWTSALVVGDHDEDVYEMLVIGEPGLDLPASYDVLAIRDGRQVVVAHEVEANFELACAMSAVMARRASIRAVE
ncbi:hypothetical protein [Rhizobium fabae]|uniref:Uncharacterized protein n=1 Tax=Rhizobium fabae TaxID=573179 RepID=A0A7W6B4P4_9HYPH|nr:hypothetical protein [Rhizobium fabae]MBB3915552.1 hypothetical protein [Rhizobium fabae]RUM11866.1 hypothetical protein EFB14_15875 [Rhizobium fabae]